MYRGWRRDILGAMDVTEENSSPKYPFRYRLAGSSYYIRNIFEIYAFKEPLIIDNLIIFTDTATASYTMVKAYIYIYLME